MATKKKTAKKAAKRKAPSADELMGLWEKACTPGEHHRRLEPLTGTFSAKTTFVMNPGDPPQHGEGTSEHRLVLGGRYLEQRYSGTTMGMPMEGVGFTGYDNVQKRYVGTWMDSFGTGVMNSVGVGRPTAKAMEFEAVGIEPTGKKRKFQCKLRIQSPDRHTYEMWTNGPKGKPYRTLFVEYARK
jgi:hypothetical protein